MRWSVKLLLVLALGLTVLAPSRAQVPEVKPGPLGEKQTGDVLGSVVKVRAKALAGARSSATLGPTREGSGVIIDSKGHILTIGYLVIEADTIEITTAQGRKIPAILAGYDHETGLGLLRAVLPLEASPIDLGVSAALEVRDPAMVAAYGGRDAVTLAYVVSQRPFAASWEYLLDSAIFTAPATSDWAGSALIGRDGKLLGIGSLLVRNSLSEDLSLPGNMFVPIDLLKPILADLIARGRRSGGSRPWLGMATEPVQGRLFVTRVSEEAPADQAGIRRGDIVLGVGKEAVSSHAELYQRIWALGEAGVEVPLLVLQGVSLKEIKVRSIDRLEYFRAKPTL